MMDSGPISVPISIVAGLGDRYRDDQEGQLSVRQVPGGWIFQAWVRDDLTPEQMAAFHAWVHMTAGQLLESEDPQGNGWYPSALSEDTWFMVVTVRHLPEW